MLVSIWIDFRFRVSQRFVHTQARIRHMLFDRGLRVPHRRLGLLLDALHGFSELGKLALAHGFVELSAELSRLALDDAHILADGAQQRRQVLGANDQQRNNAKDQELAGGEVEHRLNSVARSQASVARPVLPGQYCPASVARPVLPWPVLPWPLLPWPVFAPAREVLPRPVLPEPMAKTTVGPQAITSWRPTRPCWALPRSVARSACRPHPPEPWAARPSWRAHRPRPCPS